MANSLYPLKTIVFHPLKLGFGAKWAQRFSDNVMRFASMEYVSTVKCR